MFLPGVGKARFLLPAPLSATLKLPIIQLLSLKCVILFRAQNQRRAKVDRVGQEHLVPCTWGRSLILKHVHQLLFIHWLVIYCTFLAFSLV